MLHSSVVFNIGADSVLTLFAVSICNSTVLSQNVLLLLLLFVVQPFSVLGSTGSIGTQTLDIIAEFPEKFRLVALAAGSNVELLAQQVQSSCDPHNRNSTPTSHSNATAYCSMKSSRSALLVKSSCCFCSKAADTVDCIMQHYLMAPPALVCSGCGSSNHCLNS